jgi:glycerophosphoryl diester phosphodiesterase
MTGCCAHRGETEKTPENTLPAFEAALELSVDMIEFDLRVTADGHVVVMHDATVDRTTDGTGEIANLTLEQIKRLDAGSWHSLRFAGTSVPTLDEVLQIMPPSVLLNMELKGGERLVERVLEQVTARDMMDQCLLAARADQAALARSLQPQVRIIDMQRQETAELYIAHTADTGAQFLQFPRPQVTEEAVARCHELGITVNVFKSDEPEDQRLLIGWGVDFILTDRPDVLMQTLGRAGGGND